MDTFGIVDCSPEVFYIKLDIKLDNCSYFIINLFSSWSVSLGLLSACLGSLLSATQYSVDGPGLEVTSG